MSLPVIFIFRVFIIFQFAAAVNVIKQLFYFIKAVKNFRGTVLGLLPVGLISKGESTLFRRELSANPLISVVDQGSIRPSGI